MCPVYDFKCKECGSEVNDIFVRRPDTVVECECGEEMGKKISAPNLGGMNNLGQSR